MLSCSDNLANLTLDRLHRLGPRIVVGLDRPCTLRRSHSESVPEEIKRLLFDIYHPRFLRIQHEAKPIENFLSFSQIEIRLPLAQNHKSSRPGESHPQALTDPDMNVYAHPALTVQSVPDDVATASEQRALDRVRPPRESSVPLAVDAFSGVCISPSPSARGAGPDDVAWDKALTCSNAHSS